MPDTDVIEEPGTEQEQGPGETLAQRMARIGLITMGMCRPVPFQPHEVPGVFSSLIGNLFARKPDNEP